jgi:dihydrofolate reductase
METTMRKIIAAAFVSLDGVMQAPGGPEEDPTGGFEHGGWIVPHFDAVLGQAIDQSIAQPFDLVLGRKTYDIFAAYWPYIKDQPIADKFNAVTKYVATTSEKPLTWKSSVAIRGDVAREIAKLKRQDGPPLLIQGSSKLIQTLLANDLIDEFRVMIFPLVLGHGKRLFGDGAKPTGLKMVDSKTSTTGVTLNTYVPAGPVATGSFASDTPSAAEVERRRKLKAAAA